MIMTEILAKQKYGEIYDTNWPDANKWLVMYDVPDEIQPNLINSITGLPSKKICCNRDLMPCIDKGFQNLIDGGLVPQLKTFDGCWNIRLIRGSNDDMSAHSWGIAIDFNAATNKLGDANGDMSPEMVACFKDAGLCWGGDWARVDKMHFSLGF